MKLSVDFGTGKAGDYLVTFADGSQGVIEAEAFEANYQPVGVQAKPVIPRYMPDQDQQEDDETSVTCIECGQSTTMDKFEPNSGRCFNCITVRCPTCKQPAKRSEMAGQYCPSCLPALRDRKR